MVIVKLMFLTLAIFSLAVGQKNDWQKFVALETTRDQVEKVLGKPTKYFKTSGMYETEFGDFAIWYADYTCEKKIQEPQNKLERSRLSKLHVYLPRAFSLKDFVWDISAFKKVSYPFDDRIHFTSADGSLGYVIGKRDDGTEYFISATIQARKENEEVLRSERKAENEYLQPFL